ncbi:MAG: ACT domain-containing protein [Lachnospiraceae bacterium]|nr:ACT domain-containing protein [Candidatus Minthocola equi]
MKSEYLLIHKSVLPDYYEKVLDAKRLLEIEKAKDVSDACKKTGISRSTYYKYKDYVMEPSAMADGQKAVLSIMLEHSPGVLSNLLATISKSGANILTISQSLPIHGEAEVTLALDIRGMTSDAHELITALASCPGARSPKILAIE